MRSILKAPEVRSAFGRFPSRRLRSLAKAARRSRRLHNEPRRAGEEQKGGKAVTTPRDGDPKSNTRPGDPSASASTPSSKPGAATNDLTSSSTVVKSVAGKSDAELKSGSQPATGSGNASGAGPSPVSASAQPLKTGATGSTAIPVGAPVGSDQGAKPTEPSKAGATGSSAIGSESDKATGSGTG